MGWAYRGSNELKPPVNKTIIITIAAATDLHTKGEMNHNK